MISWQRFYKFYSKIIKEVEKRMKTNHCRFLCFNNISFPVPLIDVTEKKEIKGRFFIISGS